MQMHAGPDWKHMGGNSGQVLLDLLITRESRNLEFYVKNSQFLSAGSGVQQFF